jgi:hypothetical protein
MALLEKLKTSLGAIPDRAMRSRLLAEKLQQLAPGKAARLLQAIIVGAFREKGEYTILLDALDVELLAGRLGNPFMSDVFTAAVRLGCDELVGLLSRPEASRSADQGADPRDDDPPGVRISRAKILRGPQLLRMFGDTDIRVIRAILQNPSLTESDVLKLCSRRPAHASVQREIAASRWISRYAVKKALLLNPYTPTEIGMKLVRFVMLQDLQLIADCLDLHQDIRDIALRQLGRAGAPECA